MGYIHKEVREQHLNYYPHEEEFLVPFLDGFSVTWARRRRAYNTDLSVYFLKPEAFITETYGFTQELLMVYSAFDEMEPRAIQATERFMEDEPMKGRVEKLSYMIISEDINVKEWVDSYASVNQESRLIIPFSASGLRSASGDSWYVRNVLNTQLSVRDLFDYRLPLQKDTYFFGRRDIISNYFDAIKRSENKGIFGLRKTGKTSVLFKLERQIREEHVGPVFFYDCKQPSIRKRRWYELLERVCKDIAKEFSLSIVGGFDEVDIADTFINLVSSCPENKKIVLIFDEIEYISPIAITDMHWANDFLDFWQTFWACQSRYRRICTVVAGVNAEAVEIDSINGVQNPLFGIVSYQYLQGLGNEEMQRMVRTLGKRMGLKFENDALEYLHERYGGHPLLTRIACSLVNTSIKNKGVNRPVVISRYQLIHEEEERDSDLMFYCRHVVSELKQFYEDEYAMLEYLASGQILDFVELAAFPEYTKHLEEYGLLSKDIRGIPKISIPVVGRYVGLELAKREGRRTIYRIVEKSKRNDWLERRIQAIVKDMRFLERLIKQNNSPSLFGTNSFPEADNFAKIHVCCSQADFESFINTCNRCFVESIENYGQESQHNHYFWKEIKTAYPGLWDALYRIKLYRHNSMHLELKARTEQDLREYLNKDLDNKAPSQVDELYFVLQQATLDSLLTSIQIEANNFI